MRRAPSPLEWDPTSERLIALVRLALAAGSLFVIWIDPTQPAKYWPVAYTAFGLYVLYSAAVVHLARTGPRPWLPLATQVIDLLWILPVVYFTEAANTPFFVFFVTFTLSAGLRWGLWASWAVTVYSLAVYGSLLFMETPTPLDLNNDLMRLAYLLITGVLGGYLTEYRRRREHELKTLRTASELIGTKYSAITAMAAIVELARSNAMADAVAGVLREPGDGNVLIVRRAGDIARLTDEEASLFFSAAAGHPPHSGPGAIALASGDDMILRFAEADQGLAYPIRAGDDLVGAIFFFFRSVPRRRTLPGEFLDLLLRHVIPHLETLYVLERAPQTRVMAERRRIARDLHDGFLQVLAALGFRLDVLKASAATIPSAAYLAGDLAQLREIVAGEQKRVRAYVTEMREPLSAIAALPEIIGREVDAFRARMEMPVDVAVSAAVPELPGEVTRELALLLREALTNVEKHARARRVTVTATLEGRDVALTIRDDGVGIGTSRDAGASSGDPPMPGHGLSSMSERAQVFGGTFAIGPAESGGTEVRVSVPLPAPALSIRR